MKLSLTTAKKIVADSKILLPLVYERDGEKVNLARLRVTIARAGLAHAQDEAEQALASAALKEAEETFKTMRAELPVVAADITARIRKYAHPEDDKMPIRLAPRRVRRLAKRIVDKQIKRENRQAQKQMTT